MPIFTDPILSACIVVYHPDDQLMRTVQCFRDSNISLDLYVVDNDPDGDLCARLQWQCPGVKYRPMTKNMGYGQGNNAVLPELRSQYHLICNPDVSFDPRLLSNMIQYMEMNRNCSILTPRVFNADGTEQYLPRRAPTLRYLLGGAFEHFPGPFYGWRSKYTLRDLNPLTPTYVEFATGSFLLIRTGILRQLGGFDPKFFLYHEDSDLSRRALRNGPIVYHPDMCITHNWTRASHRDAKQTRHHLMSTVRYFNKWGWQW